MKLLDYLSPFPDLDISSLLGISTNEFKSLIRQPLYQYKNEQGAITGFFIFIHPSNRPELLEKISMDENNFVQFSTDEVYQLTRQHYLVANENEPQIAFNLTSV